MAEILAPPVAANGSKEEVALLLWRNLRYSYGGQLNTIDDELKLFLRCRTAVLDGELED